MKDVEYESLRIFDGNGKVVWEGANQTEIAISVKNFSRGVYYIDVQLGPIRRLIRSFVIGY